MIKGSELERANSFPKDSFEMRLTDEFILPLILYFKFEVLIMQLFFCRASETLWPLKDVKTFFPLTHSIEK